MRKKREEATKPKETQPKETTFAAVAATTTTTTAADREKAAVIDAMPDSVIVLDLDGKVTAVNPAYTRMVGWKPEDRIGKSFTEFKSLKAEDIERFMKLLGELIETGHAEPIETVIRTKYDREIPISVAYSLIKDAEGNPKNIIAVLRDITELKRTQEEVVAARDYTDNIIKSMIDTLIVVDPDVKIKTINQATSDLLGYSEDELIGKSVATIFAEEEEEEEEEEKMPFKGTGLKKLIDEGSIRDYDVTYRTKSGEKIPVSFSGSVMRDKEGELVGIVGIARDMRDSKDDVVRSEKLAFTGRIAASIAHEIRNPLTNVIMSVQHLAQAFKSSDPRAKHVEIVLRNAERINYLITELLNCARPPKLDMHACDIHKLLENVLASTKTKIASQKIKTVKKFTSKPSVLSLDKEQMERAFLNIIINAVEAMPKAGQLTIMTEHKENVFVVKIQDTGKGIPDGDIIRIFDPFFSSRQGGVGLGLTICYGVIVSHHGTIEVESKLKAGTTFTVSLPVG
ncbi:MAG: PAS domain S-box protein [Kiritimatiellae bacterium]|nr:PAS domain S-box protein [Kiritimatiellia bacterium]